MSKRVQAGKHKDYPRSGAYRSWEGAVQRCTNPKATGYAEYGGAGIGMHAAWRESFAAFLADMGERPAGTTLDRFPNRTGNYEPGNCRWATPREQNFNKTTQVRVIEFSGESLHLTEWAERIGISVPGLINRLRTMPLARALTEPRQGAGR